MFPSSPTCFSSSSPPGSESSFCDVPCFRAHQPAPPSSSPPGSESSFCNVPLFQPHHPLPPSPSPPDIHFLFPPPHLSPPPTPPLPPLHHVIPPLPSCHLSPLPYPSPPPPPPRKPPFCNVPHFRARQPAPPSSSPPASEFLFAMCRVSELMNALLPPLQ